MEHMDFFLESCCTSVREVLSACERGAGRIELCENLAVGGVTPSRELIQEVLRVSAVPVNVLVRPRGGDFHFSEAELDLMCEQIEECKELGVNGVVIGALTLDGDVDVNSMRRMIAVARPLSVTFHRAFDECRDPLSAFDTVCALGCDRLLTSGHETDAFTGRFLIGEMVRRAGGLIVMPGCGVRASNIDEIRRVTGAGEFHASASFWE